MRSASFSASSRSWVVSKMVTALPAGQVADSSIGLVVQTHLGQELVRGPGPRVLGGDVRPIELAEVVQQLTNPPLGMIPPRLQHHPDLGAPEVTRCDGPFSEHADRAGGGGAEPFEDLDGRRLARPVGAQEDNHLTRSHPEVDATQHAGRPVHHLEADNLDRERR